MSRRSKKLFASAFVPAYLGLWIAATACSSEIHTYLDCIGGARGAAPGIDVPAFRGDIVFGGSADDPVFTQGQDNELLTAQFFTPVVFPAGEMTISGSFSPFGSAPQRRARPTGIDFTVRRLSKKGVELEDQSFSLDVNGSDIVENTESGPELAFATKEKMQLDIMPTGNDWSTADEEVQFVFEMPMARMPSLFGVLAGAGAPPLGVIEISADAALAKRQKIVFATMAVALEIPKATVIMGGLVEPADPARSVPGKIILEIEQRDEKKKKVKKFKLVMTVSGTTINNVSKTFPGFDLLPGHTVRIQVKPKQGAFDAGDRIILNPVFF